MAETSVVRIRLTLDNNKTRTLELPAPINDELVDPDEETDLTSAAFEALQQIYQSDDGALVKGATFSIVSTTTSTVKSYEGE